MYIRSARIYDAIYGGLDYSGSARRVDEHIQRLAPGARDLLDVGCGTGRHLERLREHYAVEGLDLNDELLTMARRRLPGVPLHTADMTEAELGRRFDVVICLFSAIAYVRTADRLRAAVARIAGHLRPGGVALVEPWFTPQTYWPGHLVANFHDEPDLRVAWMYVHDRRDELSVLDIQFLVGRPEGIKHFSERHELGLFTDAQYRAAFTDAGLRVEHDPEGLWGRGLYLATA